MTDRSTAVWQRLFGTSAPGPALFVRAIVGWIFLSEGIQKFLFPDALGVGRFVTIGIPVPHFTAPFVGVVELVGGALLIVGLATRLAAIALFIDIAVAIATTKVPMLARKGFWAATHEARTDLAMAFSLVFLLWCGAGAWSLDARLRSRFGRARHSISLD
jgi:putative oxidoreductase